MSKFSKYPSIEQFRTVIRNVQHTTQYQGQDADGNAIMNRYAILPTLKFKGTVKLHGTNAGVGYNFSDTSYWCQSRENIITPEKDNAGFATFVYSKNNEFADIFNQIVVGLLSSDSGIDITQYSGCVIYGEWCGGNIQKSVALNQLPKMFVVFGIKLLAINDEEANIWLSDEFVQATIQDQPEHKIYVIFNFPSFELDIDFNDPQLSTNQLVEITNAVEAKCPVGATLGVEGIGEGVVWKCDVAPYTGSGFMFKVKGEQHQSSKVKTLAPVDIERVNTINECVENLVTENRLKQGLEYMLLNGFELTTEHTGVFIKWVIGDCVKEDLDTIVGSGLDVKSVSGAISKKAKNWFFDNL